MKNSKRLEHEHKLMLFYFLKKKMEDENIFTKTELQYFCSKMFRRKDLFYFEEYVYDDKLLTYVLTDLIDLYEQRKKGDLFIDEKILKRKTITLTKCISVLICCYNIIHKFKMKGDYDNAVKIIMCERLK